MVVQKLSLKTIRPTYEFPHPLERVPQSASYWMSLLVTFPDDTQDSREERAFRLWMNSFGNSTYINNVFEDLRNG
ncbi:hypothetical protein JHK86_010079 [Glycine max]|nr:hypothetical protein JHK86_010079 [Glycine max]